ncbi:helix-turn-helix domain-containing protein [Paucilactobacillus nenjiangensis]|uniref:helix-turn-helix domain-containing protein n=1 Tax=Paucilactobacillus nenjiangensis TaxID=1296540 RepID=UPI003BB67594
MSFGIRLKELRNSKHMSQEELGKFLNVGKSSISSYENGTREPSKESIVKIAEIFGVTTDYLLGNSNVPAWATNSDVMDLQDFLDGNVNMAYNGEDLTEEENERLRLALTQIFWDKRKRKNVN